MRFTNSAAEKEAPQRVWCVSDPYYFRNGRAISTFTTVMTRLMSWYLTLPSVLLITGVMFGISASADAGENWMAKNRYTGTRLGYQQQNYREQDTSGITNDGILDAESGRQNHMAIALSWQTNNAWLMHFQAQRQSGATEYSGYLQSGNGSLTPYSARTGNIASQISAQFGYAVNTSIWGALPYSLQITPLINLSQYRWQRNLVQYSESYRFSSIAVGTLIQWQAFPDTLLDLQALVGRTQPAEVNAPAFGFASSQSGGNLRDWSLAVKQDLGGSLNVSAFKGLGIAIQHSRTNYNHGASQIVNGLQAPANQHNSGYWAIGLQKQL
jgi:hypothetical protein